MLKRTGEILREQIAAAPAQETLAETVVPKDPARLTPERISELWNGMPGGYAGFLKQWGYMQFARAVEAEVRATLPTTSQPNASVEQPRSDQPCELTAESLAEEMLDAAIYYANGHETDFRERAQGILDRKGMPT
ncbi:hypothetical protein [Paraburkholderia elongata]|uniref:Uncharacterized protein n=1 Tax=Paraburkholderia elongata TaxID=2675747 RepID=A0A972NY36_9BURK|nr:hypothetical protein [Paraburkholderia elongata]NPT59690.1 hypothetical protein [Paraburkholderia elongata]